jgi:hypothetical protein
MNRNEDFGLVTLWASASRLWHRGLAKVHPAHRHRQVFFGLRLHRCVVLKRSRRAEFHLYDRAAPCPDTATERYVTVPIYRRQGGQYDR